MESPIQLTEAQKQEYQAEQLKKLQEKQQSFLDNFKKLEEESGLTFKPILSYREEGVLASMKIVEQLKVKDK